MTSLAHYALLVYIGHYTAWVRVFLTALSRTTGCLVTRNAPTCAKLVRLIRLLCPEVLNEFLTSTRRRPMAKRNTVIGSLDWELMAYRERCAISITSLHCSKL